MKGISIVMTIAAVCGVCAAGTADFDNVALNAGGYWNGSDQLGGFTSGFAYFHNDYNSGYGNWGGWACSSVTDNTVGGWENQYAAITGAAHSGANYGVAWQDIYNPGTYPLVELDSARVIDGAYFTNTAYAYYSMLYGDSFAKKFGGSSGNHADWFLLTIVGMLGGQQTGAVEFYLADYRFVDNSQDYIVSDWTWVSLESLGSVDELRFTLNSSDYSYGYMNTPAYFAMDTMDTVLVPEPLSMLLISAGAAAMLRRRMRV